MDHPRLIPPQEDLLYLPAQPGVTHPLKHQLMFLVVHLSGVPCRATSYLNQLQPSSQTPGVGGRSPNMTLLAEAGSPFVHSGRLIPLSLL